MNWKDIFVGAIATLTVTIIAGLAVYYITREPAKPKEETLTYSIEPISTFEAESTKVAILNIRIRNAGTAAASNVKTSITIPEFSEIKDKSISVSTGRVSGLRIDSASKGQLNFWMPSLIPEEKIIVSLLLSSKPTTEPTVLVKSDASLAKEDNIEKRQEPPTTPFIEKFLPPLLALLALLMMPVVFIYFKSRLSPTKYGASLNNTAFALLHQGLTERAKELLKKSIDEGHEGPFPLSNIAVCLALAEQFDEAQSYLQAAEQFGIQTNHNRALQQFNRGIVNLLMKKTDLGISNMKEAMKLKPRVIQNFCNSSSIIAKLFAEYPQLKTIVTVQT